MLFAEIKKAPWEGCLYLEEVQMVDVASMDVREQRRVTNVSLC